MREAADDDVRATPHRRSTVKFTIYKDKAGEFRFKLVATNGNTLASSEGYSAKASAKKAIERIKSDAAAADVVDETVAD